jgi:hypothetical protein
VAKPLPNATSAAAKTSSNAKSTSASSAASGGKGVDPRSPTSKPPATTPNSASSTTTIANASSTQKAEGETTKNQPEPIVDPCDLDILLPQAIVSLLNTGDVDARILEIEQLAEDLRGLSKTLGPYGDDGNWEGDSYVVKSVTPTPDLIRTVNIKVTPIVISSTAREGIERTEVDDKSASGTLLVR